jgi:serine/threonine protein phosphatase PrpC
LDVLKESLRTNKPLNVVIENLLDFLLAKDTREGIGCDNMSAIIVMLK